MTLAYIALGSNLGDPRQHVLKAMDALASLPGTSALRRSRLYLTPPWGLLEQPAFVNAVVALETPLAPLVLLDALQAIEQQAGR
ncbi:MAG: 2-amino-4-hydroxy-6-hydroxymethyldihydropteridine diphosphokinase, partial [Rhodanobacter sp.]